MSSVNLTHLLDGLKYGQGLKLDTVEKLNITLDKGSLKNESVKGRDSIQLSDISKRLSNEMSQFKNTIQKETNRALSENSIDELISADYVNEFIEAGKKVKKPSEDIDDLTWGMMVEIGTQIGIADPDILAELTVKDLEVFFYESNIKEKAFSLSDKRLTDEDGNSLKQLSSKQDLWKEIFSKAADGSVMRNADFSISILSSPDDKFSDGFFSSNGEKKLSELSANSLHNFLLGIESKDMSMFQYASATATYSGGEDVKDTLLIRDNLKEGYKKLQSFMEKSPTVDAQTQMLKDALNLGNWVKFFPYI